MKKYKVGEIHYGAFRELNIIVSDTGEHTSYYLNNSEWIEPLERINLTVFPSALLSNNEDSKVIHETT